MINMSVKNRKTTRNFKGVKGRLKKSGKGGEFSQFEDFFGELMKNFEGGMNVEKSENSNERIFDFASKLQDFMNIQNHEQENLKMDQFDSSDRDTIHLKKTDCGIIIDSVTLNMGMVFPQISESEEITENHSQAMFFVSYLSYALQQEEWIEKFAEKFNDENLLKVQEVTKQYSNFLSMLNENSNQVFEEQNNLNNEINFDDAVKDLKEENLEEK